MVALAPDVIVANTGNPEIAALQRATRTIPIVFCLAIDPVGTGLVASLARPGGNITGFTPFEFPIIGKWLETLKINAPSARPYPRPSEPSAPAGQAPALAADVPSPHPLTCPPNQCAVRFQHRCRWRMLLNWLPYYVQRTSRGLRLGQA